MPNHNTRNLLKRHESWMSDSTGEFPKIGISCANRPNADEDFNFQKMLQSLHDLFEQDRHLASQADAARCGICYLHFLLNQLEYRDEGFYVCQSCKQTIGHQRIPMLRKQQFEA